MTTSQAYYSDIHLSFDHTIFTDFLIEGNVFKNVRVGIYMTRMDSYPQIIKNVFEGCYESSILLEDFYTGECFISQNSFLAKEVSRMITNISSINPMYGIFNATNYNGGVRAINNIFLKSGTTSRKTIATQTTVAYSQFNNNSITGFDEGFKGVRLFGQSNPIENNKFFNNKRGIVLADENNISVSIKCNEFTDNLATVNDIGIYVESNGNVNINNSSDPTKNLFENLNYGIYYSGSGSSYYFASSNHQPMLTFNVYTINSNNGVLFGSVNCTQTRQEHNIANETFSYAWNLGENIPNPAHHETEIPLEIPQGLGKAIELEIRSINGSDILARLPVNGTGSITMKVNLNRYASGVYFYTLIADGKKLATKKMVVLK